MTHATILELAAAAIACNQAEDDLDPGLIAAICKVESGYASQAVRYEAGYPYTIFPGSLKPGVRPPACTVQTESILQCCSFGLMQIMGATARELGCKGWLTRLLEPEQGLFWGVKYFYKQWRHYQPMFGPDAAIAAYNAGSPRTGKSGAFENQAYVDRVKRYRAAN